MFWGQTKTPVPAPIEIFEKSLWTVAGGKGGTGKSVITANMGLALSTLGYNTIVVDADLGAANLHTCLNIRRPAVTLEDFISNRVSGLGTVLLDTPNPKLKLISGGSELLGIANLNYQKKMKLMRHLNQLNSDFILVDLGAGTGFNVLDFFLLSNEGIIICNPEPNAKLDAYSFLKNGVFRKLQSSLKDEAAVQKILQSIGSDSNNKGFQVSRLLKIARSMNGDTADKMSAVLSDFRPRLIMNKVRRKNQVAEGYQLVNLAKEYLGIQLDYLGFVEYDQKVIDASEKMMPFLLEYPSCAASQSILKIVYSLGISQNDGSERRFKKQLSKEMKTVAKNWE